jgi:hypothetical protein
VNPTGADQSLIWHMIMRESMVGSMIEQWLILDRIRNQWLDFDGFLQALMVSNRRPTMDYSSPCSLRTATRSLLHENRLSCRILATVSARFARRVHGACLFRRCSSWRPRSGLIRDLFGTNSRGWLVPRDLFPLGGRPW